jgi:hypothetical protein
MYGRFAEVTATTTGDERLTLQAADEYGAWKT